MKQRFARLFAGSVLAMTVSAAWAQATVAAPADDVVRFAITRFEVGGNTLLPQEDVERAVAPFTGPGRDFGDVQRALEALEALYHERGYNVVTVQLPEQVEATIVEADAVVKGQTASSSYKPAILDNGVRVMVPPHIESGTRIVVDVYEREYVRKAD